MKLKNMIARVIVNLVNGSEYSFTALNGENITGVEHLQEFGFASLKPDGENANGIALFHGGDRGNSTLLVLEVPKFKPDLSSGESALFNAFNALIKLKASGNIELNGSSNLGLVKITELTTKLNAHILEYNTYISQFNAHSHVGAGAIDTVALEAVVFVEADYENDKVVH